jgi:hypothetical protein
LNAGSTVSHIPKTATLPLQSPKIQAQKLFSFDPKLLFFSIFFMILLAAFLVLVFAGAYKTYLRATSPPEVPHEIPWIRLEGKRTVFAKWRARVRAFEGCIDLIEEGYQKARLQPLPSFSRQLIFLLSNQFLKSLVQGRSV